jgi:antirestriction protein ArdC
MRTSRPIDLYPERPEGRDGLRPFPRGRKLANVTKTEIQAEALARARGGQSTGNWAAIISGFVARGLLPESIIPRENVLTYQAWRALGRQVRKGEHGVQVTTWVPMMKKDADGKAQPIGKRPKSATVFHVSQTDLVQGGAA